MSNRAMAPEGCSRRRPQIRFWQSAPSDVPRAPTSRRSRLLKHDEMRLDQGRTEKAPPLPACGERVGVRGSLKEPALWRLPLTRRALSDANGTARRAATSPRKRGKVNSRTGTPIRANVIMLWSPLISLLKEQP